MRVSGFLVIGTRRGVGGRGVRGLYFVKQAKKGPENGPPIRVPQTQRPLNPKQMLPGIFFTVGKCENRDKCGYCHLRH